MTTAIKTANTDQCTATYVTLCPLGCGKYVTTEQDEIHYCVRRTMDGRNVISIEREYVGTWDGEAKFFGKTNHEVEMQMRPYREEQLASDLRYSATALDGGSPDWEGEPDPGPPSDEEDEILDKIWLPSELDEDIDYDDAICHNCGDRHRTAQCPESALAMSANSIPADSPSPDATPLATDASPSPLGDALVASPAPEMSRQRLLQAGHAIIRQWMRERTVFLGVLSDLDSEAIFLMADAATEACKDRHPWMPITTDRMLAAWQAAASGA